MCVLALGASLSFLLGSSALDARAAEAQSGAIDADGVKASVLVSEESAADAASLPESDRIWTLKNGLEIYGTWSQATDIYQDMVVVYLREQSIFVPIPMAMLSEEDVNFVTNDRTKNPQTERLASENLAKLKWINFEWDWIEEEGSDEYFLSVTFASNGETIYYYPQNFINDFLQIRDEISSLHRVWTLQDGRSFIAQWGNEGKVYTERRSRRQYLHLSNLSGAEEKVYLSSLSAEDRAFVENAKNLIKEMTDEIPNAQRAYLQHIQQQHQQQQQAAPAAVPVRQDRPVLREAWRRGSPYIPYF